MSAGRQVDRRRFILTSVGSLAGAASARHAALTSLEAHRPPRGPSPTWLPSADLLLRLPRLLELGEVPGLSFAVVSGGRVWERGFGMASVDPHAPVTDDTVFEAASLGKVVFATLVLRMVEAGRLALDRPVYEYLPGPEADSPGMRRVTVRHVLSHTTGLPNWRKTPGPLVPTTEPGTQFTYSGEGFFYLQRVVEAVSGRPIARLLEENVLRPLGMTQSSYVWRPEYEQRMAVGYDAQGNREEVFAAMGRRAYIIAREWGKPLLDWRYEDAARTVQLIKQEWPILPVYMVPNVASSLLTTARDYARFLLATTATPPDRALGLSLASLEAMGTLQVRINSALGWGLGWGIQDDEYGRVLWQWGANNSFRNFALVDRINRRAIVVLTNSENGTPVYERVIASLTGHDHPAFLRA